MPIVVDTSVVIKWAADDRFARGKTLHGFAQANAVRISPLSTP